MIVNGLTFIRPYNIMYFTKRIEQKQYEGHSTDMTCLLQRHAFQCLREANPRATRTVHDLLLNNGVDIIITVFLVFFN